MKIILIRPPQIWDDENALTKIEIRMPPVGISYIASFLRSKGYNDIKVIDMFEENWDWINDFFSHNDADVIGISCLTGQHFSCFKLAKLAKEKMNPSPVVILGGPHPSANSLDRQILEYFHDIDFIVRNEGEITFFELIEAIKNKGNFKEVAGITLREENNKVFATPDREPIKDLDCLPFPDYSYFDFDKNSGSYDGHLDIGETKGISGNLRFGPIITSRGCPYRCQFCSCFWGNRIRFRSPENILEEMKTLYHTKNISHFSIVDDCFNISIPRIKKLCHLIKDVYLPFTWTAVGRVDTIDEGLLVEMKEAGCVGLDFGVESGSERILRAINKNITVAQVERAFDLTKKLGIKAKALLMVGNPGETKETISETLRFIKKCRPKIVVVSPARIFPNSDLHKIALEQGVISATHWIDSAIAPLYTAKYTAEQLRLYRLNILFTHYMTQKDIVMAIKIFILICGVRFLMGLGLEVNSVRNFCLDSPLFRPILRKLSISQFRVKGHSK